MQMDVQDDASHLFISCHATMACCIGSQAIWLVSKYTSENDGAHRARVTATNEPDTFLIREEPIAVLPHQDLSPPTIQSLLCTFLI